MGDFQDGPPRKQAVIGLSQDSYGSNQPKAVDSETRPLPSPVDYSSVEAAIPEAAVSIL